MLPLPGAASSSWSLFRTRCTGFFDRTNVRIGVAFWMFGLVNNVLYVIILSAALDLVGPTIPKSAVLLFDVVPSFFVKLTAPYYIQNVPYSLRILVFAALSTCGMLIIALTPSSVSPSAGGKPGVPDQAEILLKMSGVVLASISSGGGELSFLGLTSYYGTTSLAAWGSGTGGAGLVGAGVYVLATTTLGLSVRSSLLAFSLLPVVMLASFFVILPPRILARNRKVYQPIPESEERDDEDYDPSARSRLLRGTESVSPSSMRDSDVRNWRQVWAGLHLNLRRARGLVFP